jgi:hypothetical protein
MLRHASTYIVGGCLLVIAVFVNRKFIEALALEAVTFCVISCVVWNNSYSLLPKLPMAFSSKN